jgi:hypothetical protein
VLLLAIPLGIRAASPGTSLLPLAVMFAASAAALVCGFSESRWVDAVAAGRRTPPTVFFRLAVAMVLTLLATIAVSLLVGLARIALR